MTTTFRRPGVLEGAILLGLVLLSTGCATRTRGLDRAGPSTPPPPGTWPSWASPDPLERGVPDAPRGFKVEGTDGSTIRMRRAADIGPTELWTPRPEDVDQRHPVLTMIDPDLVERWTWTIAVLESEDDEDWNLDPVPERRAIDGLLLAPARHHVAHARTLVVVLGSLARYNPPEQWLATAMLRRGFPVLLSSPPVASPLGPAAGRAIVEPANAPERAGLTLAREVDLATATWSVGLETILDHLDPQATRRFDTIVLMGASSGAIALPSVAIRLGLERDLAALVFIGGGANAGLVLAETSLGSEDLRLERRGGSPDSEATRIFLDRFDDHVVRDDEGIWQWLDQHPSVVLEAGFDRAIPFDARTELRRRLPGASHWWFPVGHYGLFLLLSAESNAIAEWTTLVLRNRNSDSMTATSGDSGTDPPSDHVR